MGGYLILEDKMSDNTNWVAGVCKGFSKEEIHGGHSVAFLDGYDYGILLRDNIDALDLEDLPKPINLRSADVRGLLQENTKLKTELEILKQETQTSARR